jgi:hypothetical protein
MYMPLLTLMCYYLHAEVRGAGNRTRKLYNTVYTPLHRAEGFIETKITWHLNLKDPLPYQLT